MQIFFEREGFNSFQAVSHGHGVYLLSIAGFIFHSDNDKLTYTPQKFRFQAGDVITVTVNPFEQIIFSKDNGESLEVSFKRRERED
jgi:hypothetical protein